VLELAFAFILHENHRRIDDAAKVDRANGQKIALSCKEHFEREIAELRRKLLEGKRSQLWQ
jgi:hypothetical protein